MTARRRAATAAARALATAAAIMLTGTRADILSTDVFTNPQCLGAAYGVRTEFPGAAGCLRTGGITSSVVRCVNASFAAAVTYATSDCTGPSTEGDANLMTAVGCQLTPVGSIRSTCAGGTYVPPTTAAPGTALLLEYSGGFPGGSTCIDVNPATLSTATVLANGLCIPVDTTTSARYDCNSTHLITSTFLAGCAGAPISVKADALGCAASTGASVVVTMCTAVPGNTDNSWRPSESVTAAIGGSAAFVLVTGAVLVSRWRRPSPPERRPLLTRERTRRAAEIAVGTSDASVSAVDVYTDAPDGAPDGPKNDRRPADDTAPAEA